MSAFKQSMRKLGVRAGLLAGASAAIFAIVGANAGSAMATGPPVCPNSKTINGRGSSLQKIAQTEVWTVKYNTKCSEKPKVIYTSTSSGSGLETFGFTPGSTLNHEFQFIGTDDGPNKEQIEHAETASGTQPIIIPVTQTAIAVVVHLPTGCKFKKGKGITWLELNKVFGGNGITKWSQFSNIEGGAACEKEIMRVVRKESSGTTYQFKNYLSTLEIEKGAEGLPCTTEGHTKWGELREVGAGGKPNITWPECSGGTVIATAEGGGALAQKVVETESSIGYASLPDAKAKGAEVALLQNGVTSEVPTYAEPGKAATSTARCENARYTVPPQGRITGTGVAVDWSEVFGAQPSVGGTEYPLCTLTYDVAWLDYTLAGYESAEETQADVKDYFENYVTVEPGAAGGQKDLKEASKWYSPLPASGGRAAATNVQEAAEFAAMRIGTGTSGKVPPAEASPEEFKLTTGTEKTVTVTNKGSLNMEVSELTQKEIANSEIKSSTCTIGLVLEPSGSCHFVVRSTNTITPVGTTLFVYRLPFWGIFFARHILWF